jgi:hypothetical protein
MIEREEGLRRWFRVGIHLQHYTLAFWNRGILVKHTLTSVLT